MYRMPAIITRGLYPFKGSCLRNHFWIFFALDKTKNPKKFRKKVQNCQKIVKKTLLILYVCNQFIAKESLFFEPALQAAYLVLTH